MNWQIVQSQNVIDISISIIFRHFYGEYYFYYQMFVASALCFCVSALSVIALLFYGSENSMRNFIHCQTKSPRDAQLDWALHSVGGPLGQEASGFPFPCPLSTFVYSIWASFEIFRSMINYGLICESMNDLIRPLSGREQLRSRIKRAPHKSSRTAELFDNLFAIGRRLEPNRSRLKCRNRWRRLSSSH